MSASEIRWLSVAECWQRLEQHPNHVGRIGTCGSAPDIVPVNYVTDGRSVVFRTAEGRKLEAIDRQERIVFEVDDVDAATSRAWSVVLRGFAVHVTDPDQLAHLRTLPLELWAPGRKPEYVRIATDQIAGREIN